MFEMPGSISISTMTYNKDRIKSTTTNNNKVPILKPSKTSFPSESSLHTRNSKRSQQILHSPINAEKRKLCYNNANKKAASSSRHRFLPFSLLIFLIFSPVSSSAQFQGLRHPPQQQIQYGHYNNFHLNQPRMMSISQGSMSMSRLNSKPMNPNSNFHNPPQKPKNIQTPIQNQNSQNSQNFQPSLSTSDVRPTLAELLQKRLRRLELATRPREARRGLVEDENLPLENRLPFLTSKFNQNQNLKNENGFFRTSSKFIGSPHQPKSTEEEAEKGWVGLLGPTLDPKPVTTIDDIITESKARQKSLKLKKISQDDRKPTASKNNVKMYSKSSVSDSRALNNSKSNSKSKISTKGKSTKSSNKKIGIHKTSSAAVVSSKTSKKKFSSSYSNKNVSNSSVKVPVIQSQPKKLENDSRNSYKSPQQNNFGSGNLTVLEIIKGESRKDEIPKGSFSIEPVSSDSNLIVVNSSINFNEPKIKSSNDTKTPFVKNITIPQNVVEMPKSSSTVKKDNSHVQALKPSDSKSEAHLPPPPPQRQKPEGPISITIPIVNPSLDPYFYQKTKLPNESFYDHYTSLMNMNKNRNSTKEEMIVSPISLVTGQDQEDDDSESIESNLIESTSLPKLIDPDSGYQYQTHLPPISSSIATTFQNQFQPQPLVFTNLEARNAKNYPIYPQQRNYQNNPNVDHFNHFNNRNNRNHIHMTENPRAFYPPVSPIQSYPLSMSSPSHPPPPPPLPYQNRNHVFNYNNFNNNQGFKSSSGTARMGTSTSWLKFKMQDEESNESLKDDRHGLPIVDPHHPVVQNALNPFGNPATEPEKHILKKAKILNPQSLVPLDKTLVICSILFGWLVFFAGLVSYEVWGKKPHGKSAGGDKLGMKPIMLNIPQDGTDPFFASSRYGS